MRAGCQGIREGRDRPDPTLRATARDDLGHYLAVLRKEFDSDHPAHVMCPNCQIQAVCPECGEPVYMTVPSATLATRIAIMDAVRKIAGIKPETNQESGDNGQPFEIHIHGVHPGHAREGMHVVEEPDQGDEQEDGGRCSGVPM